MMNSVKVSKNAYVASSTYTLTNSTYPSQPSYTYLPLSSQPSYTYSLPSLQSTTTYLPPSSYPNNDSHPTVKVVPDLTEFLKELDATYGEGKYTQYLEIFENNDIRVNLISKISDEWWENKLHITSLGHILTFKEAASKYA